MPLFSKTWGMPNCSKINTASVGSTFFIPQMNLGKLLITRLLKELGSTASIRNVFGSAVFVRVEIQNNYWQRYR